MVVNRSYFNPPLTKLRDKRIDFPFQYNGFPQI